MIFSVTQNMHIMPVCFGCVFSHLMGMFYRTIRMIENGIKPVYVFDGKPPDMKSGEVCKKMSVVCNILIISVITGIALIQ